VEPSVLEKYTASIFGVEINELGRDATVYVGRFMASGKETERGPGQWEQCTGNLKMQPKN
jgi:hypothetical protein